MNQIEPTGTAAVASLFKKLWEGTKNPPGWIKEKYQVSDPFGLEAKKYVSHVFKTYNSMKIIGMNEPSPLDDIYINVCVRDKDSFSEIISDYYWEKKHRKYIPTSETKSFPAQKVVSENNRVLILGRPGAGKTTFLKYLAISSLNSDSISHIPVFVSLKEWSQKKNTNLETVVISQFDTCHFERKKEFVKNLLRKGKCILLFDGFDEIDPDFRRAAIDQIKDFVKAWSSNKYVLSCRTAANTYVFDRFTEIEVADFTENQINVFIRKWFKNERISNKCLEELTSPENLGLFELAKNPLLLTLLCIAYQESLSFPESKVQLYEQALDALLKKWDTSRDVIRYNPYKKLTNYKKELLLSRIAVRKAVSDSNVFNIKEIRSVVDDFMIEIADADNYDGTLSVLEAIESQHGILSKVSDQEFAFSHLTFQEYYIARYICDRPELATLESVLNQYIGEPSWNEILTICCGLQRDASDYLYRYRVSLELKKTQGVKSILELSKGVICDESSYPMPLSIFLALCQILTSGSDKNENSGQLNSMASTALLVSKSIAKAYSIDTNMEAAAIKVTGLGYSSGRFRIDCAGDEIYNHINGWDSLQKYMFGLYVFCVCLNNEATATKTYKKQLIDSVLGENCPPPPQMQDNPFVS